jgi:hypothetical protein
MNNFSYVDHIAICMCNRLQCWFKHPLPYWDLFERLTFSQSKILHLECFATKLRLHLTCNCCKMFQHTSAQNFNFGDVHPPWPREFTVDFLENDES